MDLINFENTSPEQREELAERLDDLLQNYEVYHNNIRKIHWERSLHPYLDFNSKVDFLHKVSSSSQNKLAEQVLSLGKSPSVAAHTPSYLPSKLFIRGIDRVEGFEDAVQTLIGTSKELLEEVKDIFYLAADYQEESTMEQMNMLASQLSMTAFVFSSVRLSIMN
ncbi:MAG: hypothetical protein MRZ79_26295 [Bacteroidia bacterium]|nr:hypothetical protein [Bacteroidia bacterium]